MSESEERGAGERYKQEELGSGQPSKRLGDRDTTLRLPRHRRDVKGLDDGRIALGAVAVKNLGPEVVSTGDAGHVEADSAWCGGLHDFRITAEAGHRYVLYLVLPGARGEQD